MSYVFSSFDFLSFCYRHVPCCVRCEVERVGTIECLCVLECPRYPVMGLQYLEESEAYIWFAKIDVGLQFPYYSDPNEMCQYYYFVRYNWTLLLSGMWLGFGFCAPFKSESVL